MYYIRKHKIVIKGLANILMKKRGKYFYFSVHKCAGRVLKNQASREELFPKKSITDSNAKAKQGTRHPA